MGVGLSLGVLTAAQLLSSLAYVLVVLGTLGAGAETDAWVAAQTVPLVVASVFTAAFQGAWQSPLAVSASEPLRWLSMQRSAHGQMIASLGLLTVALCVSSATWVPMLFPGFTTSQAASAVCMTWLLLPASLLSVHAAIMTTALRTRNRFLRGEFAALGVSLAILPVAAFGAPVYGIEFAAMITLCRSVITVGILFVLCGMPIPQFAMGPFEREQRGRLVSLLAGASLYKTGPFVDRYWSSLAPTGGMTALNLASTAMSAVVSVVDRAVCAPALPALARLASAGSYAELRVLYRHCVLRCALIGCAVALALLAVYPFWPALIRPLGFQEALATDLWIMCMLLVAYVIPASSGGAIVSSFYAMGDTRTPVRVGVIGFLGSVALKSALFLGFGLLGLVIGTVVHYIGNMGVLVGLLERRLHHSSSAQPHRSRSPDDTSE